MLSDRIWDLRFANFVVYHLHKLRSRKKQDFHCVKTPENTSVKIDNVIGGAHIVEITKPMCCIDFDVCKKCEKDCVNHGWNNNYIDLVARLRVAKHERNMMILGLFLPKEKIAQYLEYRRLKKYVDAKREKYDAARKEWMSVRRKISQTGFGCACIINHPKVFSGIIAPEFVDAADNVADFCNKYVPGGVCVDETCSWFVNNKEVAPVYKDFKRCEAKMNKAYKDMNAVRERLFGRTKSN